MANSQFNKAVDDTIYKDIYPMMLTVGQVGNAAVAGRAGPYAPVFAAPGHFVLEAARLKSQNYDQLNYSWESAFIDAGRKAGIDLVAGMGAKEMSRAIAEKLNLSAPSRFLLEKGIDNLLGKGFDHLMENSQN